MSVSRAELQAKIDVLKTERNVYRALLSQLVVLAEQQLNGGEPDVTSLTEVTTKARHVLDSTPP